MKRRSCGRSKQDEEIDEIEIIPEKTLKNEIIEEEKNLKNNQQNDGFSEISNNIYEENSSKTTTQKNNNNLMTAAQLGMKGPQQPINEQPTVDKMFNSLLVKEISHHPALYDFTCDDYKSIEARNKNWEEVSLNVNQPLEFVRTRWKTLRDRFKKEVRRIKQIQLQQKQTENAFIGCWHHFEEMIFLLPFVRDKVEEIINYGDNEHQNNLTSADGIIQSSLQTFLQSFNLFKQRQFNSNNLLLNNENQQQIIIQQLNNNNNNTTLTSSSTAAILDLAINAVNKCNNEREEEEIIEDKNKEENNEDINGNNKINEGEFLNKINNIKLNNRQRYNNKQQYYQNNKNLNKNYLKYPQPSGEIIENDYDDEDDEDQLFCRIILKKLGKLEERQKDTAKIKIMEIFRNLQYGDNNNNNDNNN